MTAVLGTLPFIATLWLLVVLGAAVLEESGAKIAAALKGKSASSVTPCIAAGEFPSRQAGGLSASRRGGAPPLDPGVAC